MCAFRACARADVHAHGGTRTSAKSFFSTDLHRAALLVGGGRGGGGITSDVVFVGGVDFFYSSVAEGQLSHPVHASPHARGQTQIGAGRRGVETVSAEVIRAETQTERREKKKAFGQRRPSRANGTARSEGWRRCCTSGPGRCHRRTRRRYVPGHIPERHETHNLIGVHTFLKRGRSLLGKFPFLGKDFPHMFLVIPHEKQHTHSGICAFGWTPRS